MNSFKIKNIGIYDSKITQPKGTISRNRKTTDFELELPLTNGGISYIDSHNARITTNMFICVKPNQIRSTKFPFKCSYAHISVFDKNLSDILLAMPNFIEIKDSTAYAEIFEELQKYYVSQTATNEIMMQSLLLKLIYILCTENETNLKTKKYVFFINKAIDFINENLSVDLSLENVAKYVNMSPIYFHNCFKKATGKTLHEYVEEQRITKSIHIMLNTNMTLAEIAYECGFSSQSYFNYAFKRKMNSTPKNYIKSLNDRYEV